jgi:hypothetical protein
MSRRRQTIAQRLVEAQQTAAILTTFNEIDMSAVGALRKEHQEAFQQRYGVKLGFMSFFVKAAIDALKTYPGVNAEVRGSDIVYKDHYDIGVAVGGGKGLVVPVVRGADAMSFAELEKTIADLAVRARDNKLTMKELEGGTFTISNGGVYGSLLSTPILNPPQSGILGLHAIQTLTGSQAFWIVATPPSPVVRVHAEVGRDVGGEQFGEGTRRRAIAERTDHDDQRPSVAVPVERNGGAVSRSNRLVWGLRLIHSSFSSGCSGQLTTAP